MFYAVVGFSINETTVESHVSFKVLHMEGLGLRCAIMLDFCIYSCNLLGPISGFAQFKIRCMFFYPLAHRCLLCSCLVKKPVLLSQNLF